MCSRGETGEHAVKLRAAFGGPGVLACSLQEGDCALPVVDCRGAIALREADITKVGEFGGDVGGLAGLLGESQGFEVGIVGELPVVASFVDLRERAEIARDGECIAGGGEGSVGFVEREVYEGEVGQCAGVLAGVVVLLAAFDARVGDAQGIGMHAGAEVELEGEEEDGDAGGLSLGLGE